MWRIVPRELSTKAFNRSTSSPNRQLPRRSRSKAARRFLGNTCSYTTDLTDGESTVNWIWEVLMLEKVVNASLVCAEIGLMGMLAATALTFLAQVFELVAKRRRHRD